MAERESERNTPSSTDDVGLMVVAASNDGSSARSFEQIGNIAVSALGERQNCLTEAGFDSSDDSSCEDMVAATLVSRRGADDREEEGSKKISSKHSFLRMILDDEGEPIGYDNEEWKVVKVPKLRTIVSELHGSARGMLKPQLIEALKEAYEIWKTGSVREREMKGKGPDKATANCKMRLLNVIFSDDHVEDFEKLMERSDNRGSLDNGTAGNQKWFWGPVRDSFVDSIAEYGNNLFEKDKYLKDRPGLNLNKFGEHSWAKLRDMWHEIRREYNEFYKNFKASGEHSNDFFQFCRGKLPLYYLHLLLENKKDLLEMVKADLPPQDGRDSSSSDQPASAKKKKKEAAFTDLLGDLLSDRSSGNTEMTMLIESRNASHLLELEKVEVTKAFQKMEEDRRHEEAQKRTEETRASQMRELDGLNMRIDRVRQLLVSELNEDFLAEYKEEESTLRARKRELHELLFKTNNH